METPQNETEQNKDTRKAFWLVTFTFLEESPEHRQIAPTGICLIIQIQKKKCYVQNLHCLRKNYVTYVKKLAADYIELSLNISMKKCEKFYKWFLIPS